MDEAMELRGRIEAAEQAYSQSGCDPADEPLEIRLRTFSNGGKHLVRQCMRCGAQRGNALSPASARSEMTGQVAPDFDLTIEQAHRHKRTELLNALMNLKDQEVEAYRPGMLDRFAEAHAERLDFSKKIAEKVRSCAQEIAAMTSDAQAAEALSREAIAMRRRLWEEQLREADRFTDEDALKSWLVHHLSEDFELYPEVPGTHLATGVRVQIDFLAFPKPHLIEEDFLAEYFGIEVKHLNTETGFSQKASKAFWQTVSYTDAEFFVDSKRVRLRYAVLFSSLSFEKERLLLRSFGSTGENDAVVWQTLKQLANHANVGTLEIKGDRSTFKGWLLAFSGGCYFSRSPGEAGPVYRLANRQMVLKNRIGSF